MTATHAVFLHYIVLIVFLLLVLAGYRTYFAKATKMKTLKFAPDGSGLSDVGYRLTRAHMNAVECFPFIGGLLIYAIATNQTGITDGLAHILMAARVIQTGILMASTSNFAIQLRFVAFLVQFGICIYWLFGFLAPLM
jgi:uncharacterized MAPEG superfamily protein